MAIFLKPRFTVLTDTGALASGYKIYTYETGTNTPKSTFPTKNDASASTNPNANPTITDANGEAVLFPASGQYRISIDTSADVTMNGYPIDGLAGNDVSFGAGEDLVLSSTSDILVNTDKFTVAGATGNTVIAGTLDVTGAVTASDDIRLANAKGLDFRNQANSANVEVITLDSSDDVQIATTINNDITSTVSGTGVVNLTTAGGTAVLSAAGLLTAPNITATTALISSTLVASGAITGNSVTATVDLISAGLEVTGNVAVSTDAGTITTTGAIVGSVLGTGQETFEYDEGTFTANFTGFSITTTNPATWTKIGKSVTLNVNGSGVTGDGGTAVTIDNLPSAIQPSTYTAAGSIGLVTDNVTLKIGSYVAVNDSSGVMSFGRGDGLPFTASVARAISTFAITYNI